MNMYNNFFPIFVVMFLSYCSFLSTQVHATATMLDRSPTHSSGSGSPSLTVKEGVEGVERVVTARATISRAQHERQQKKTVPTQTKATTQLHNAALNMNKNQFKRYLEDNKESLNVNAVDENGYSPFMVAVMAGKAEHAQMILDDHNFNFRVPVPGEKGIQTFVQQHAYDGENNEVKNSELINVLRALEDLIMNDILEREAQEEQDENEKAIKMRGRITRKEAGKRLGRKLILAPSGTFSSDEQDS